jgi:hypothetical protein
MSDPIIIERDEQSPLDPERADGGLPPVVGVQSFQVFRASKVLRTDGLGYTYHHHVDMACWKGRLYVGWNSCEKDEDVWPSRELYSTSTDGRGWSDPQELFPQGVSTPLRMYFFHDNPAGKMLAIAGLRVDTKDTDEDTKNALVVREIRADHSLGDVFTLQANASVTKHPPRFDESRDADFVAACKRLLADNVYLEQQDRGRLLGERHMKWHDPSAWPDRKVPGINEKWVAGKAYSFFRRGNKDELVGVSKMGWVTTSPDGGKTWTQPVQPPTLVTCGAKVWSQRTADGRYALVYNPATKNRFPLAIVTGDDGVRFKDMRIVQGELPRQRYEGKFRSLGPQYVRGISTWADDGSRANEKAMWLVYSISKEDIWVSRLDLPVKPNGDGWNLYSPRWASATIESDGSVRLEDRDPYDYASATRVFPQRAAATISFDVVVEHFADEAGDTLEMDLIGQRGARLIRLRLAQPAAGQKLRYALRADAGRGRYDLTRDGKPLATNVPFTELSDTINRMTFRTGAYRNVGGANPVDPQTDRPHTPVAFRVVNFALSS